MTFYPFNASQSATDRNLERLVASIFMMQFFLAMALRLKFSEV